MYTTASPCWNCFKLIANAGIRRIYYGEFYRDAKSLKIARQLGIDLVDLASVVPTMPEAKPAPGCDWEAPAGPPASGSRGGSAGGRSGGRGVRRRA
jgi:hypothetical protein